MVTATPPHPSLSGLTHQKFVTLPVQCRSVCVVGEGGLPIFCHPDTQANRVFLHHSRMLAVEMQRERENGESSTSGNFKNQKGHTSLPLIFHWAKQVVWHDIVSRGHVKGKVEFCNVPRRAARNI